VDQGNSEYKYIGGAAYILAVIFWHTLSWLLQYHAKYILNLFGMIFDISNIYAKDYFKIPLIAFDNLKKMIIIT